MKIAVVFTRWLPVPLGGWFSYTVHLVRGLRLCGAEVDVYCLQSRREKIADLGRGVQVHFVDPVVARSVLQKYDAIHVSFLSYEREKTESLASPPAALDVLSYVKRKVPLFLTIHDPTETKNFLHTRRMVEGSIAAPKAIVAIRSPVVAHLKGLGGKNVVYIPHPYEFNPLGTATPKENVVVATSRVDFDKHTDLLLAAKPTKGRIDYWTGGINRIYVYHKLKELGWPPPTYRGAFGKEPADLLAVYGSAKALVDMSAISGDGGGTQYTFLEALDYGCALLLNSKWDRPDPAENALVAGEDYLSCTTAEDITQAVDRVCSNEAFRVKLWASARQRVARHDAKAIGAKYLQLYEAA